MIVPNETFVDRVELGNESRPISLATTPAGIVVLVGDGDWSLKDESVLKSRWVVWSLGLSVLSVEGWVGRPPAHKRRRKTEEKQFVGV